MTRAPRTTIATLLVLLVLATGCSRVTKAAAPTTAETPTAVTLCTNNPGTGSPLSDQGDLAAQRAQWALATQLYQSVLSSTTESAAARGCAARGLAYVQDTQPGAATNEAQDTAKAWDAFFADWIKPASRFALPFLMVLLVLLTIAQLASRLLVRPDAQGRAAGNGRPVAWYNAGLPHGGGRDGLGRGRAVHDPAAGARHRPAQHRLGRSRSASCCVPSRW